MKNILYIIIALFFTACHVNNSNPKQVTIGEYNYDTVLMNDIGIILDNYSSAEFVGSDITYNKILNDSNIKIVSIINNFNYDEMTISVVHPIYVDTVITHIEKHKYPIGGVDKIQLPLKLSPEQAISKYKDTNIRLETNKMILINYIGPHSAIEYVIEDSVFINANTGEIIYR